MLSKADLHIHTTCSDGRLEPLQVVDVAINSKLRSTLSCAKTLGGKIKGPVRAKLFTFSENVHCCRKKFWQKIGAM